MTDGRWRTVRVATYNIHRCRGLDGRTRPDRIAAVLRGLDADVLALQEVIGAGPRHGGHAEELGAALGMGWVMAPTRHLRGPLFGNVVLSRFPVAHHAQYDLSWKTCEPRCCQRVDLDLDGALLHLYNVHLGTAYPRAARPGAAARGASSATAASRARRSCSATSTSGRAGPRRRCSRAPAGVDLSSAPAAPAHVSGLLPDRAPRSHLLPGRGRSRERGARAHAARAHRVGSSAAGRGAARRIVSCGAL